MSSNWATVTRAVTLCESAVIFLIYAVFLLLLSRNTKVSQSYRIVLIIIAVHGLLYGFNIWLVLSAHVFHHGHFSVPLYGPLVPLLPKVLQHASMICLTIFSYLIWQLIPGPCLMQYLALTRPQLNIYKRSIISYLITICFVVYDYFFVRELVPTAEYEKIIQNTSREAFDLDESEQFVVYGLPFARMPENNNRTCITLALGCVISTYSLSYIIFGTIIHMIRRHLKSFGVKLSEKTLKMENTFYRMQLLQSILPVVIISFPVAIFIVPSLTSSDLGPATLAMTFSVWMVPMVQGSVFVYYLKTSLQNQKASQVNIDIISEV
ncbi:hypothetical protein PMAYCL1PPCAC_07835, partial [Pristionchus mayeri]